MGSIGSVNTNGEYRPSVNSLINALPARNKSKVDVQNPLYEDSPIVYMAFDKLADIEQRNRGGITTHDEIFVDRIISNQPWLDKNKLLEQAELSTQPPEISVVKYQDEYVVIDGNHRAVIAKMKSQPKIRAKIIDLDKRKR